MDGKKSTSSSSTECVSKNELVSVTVHRLLRVQFSAVICKVVDIVTQVLFSATGKCNRYSVYRPECFTKPLSGHIYLE